MIYDITGYGQDCIYWLLKYKVTTVTKFTKRVVDEKELYQVAVDKCIGRVQVTRSGSIVKYIKDEVPGFEAWFQVSNECMS